MLLFRQTLFKALNCHLLLESLHLIHLECVKFIRFKLVNKLE